MACGGIKRFKMKYWCDVRRIKPIDDRTVGVRELREKRVMKEY